MQKEPRWTNEDWTSSCPDVDKIQCKDCIYRAEDVYHNGKLMDYGACLTKCEAFPFKPIGILLGEEKCEYHYGENEEDD